MENRACDTCDEPDDSNCLGCDRKHGRRKEDKCGEHQDMLDMSGKSNTFMTQIKTGVAVASFFMLAFLGWIVLSNNLSAQNMDNRQTNFEKKTEKVQAEHKQEVSAAIKEIKCQVDEMVKAVNRIESTVNTLVQTTSFELERAEKERERNRKNIEALKEFNK